MQDPTQTFVGITPPPALFPEQEQLRCPRCESNNTKFCYYNNYNLSQPRHFCKSCRRYWTKGGSLRNIPVGGASRKNNKRPSSSSSASAKRHSSAVQKSDGGGSSEVGGRGGGGGESNNGWSDHAIYSSVSSFQ